MRTFFPSAARQKILSAVALGAVAGTVVVAAAAEDMVVSQKNRQFEPGILTVSKDQAVDIINDDGGLVHHAYIESETFNYDSGDQNPGSRARIVFSVRGDFQVLCGIHPKMKLSVHVK